LWGIVGLKPFDVLPVARHLLVEQMAEGVMVLDERNRVVDLNPAARRLSRWSGPSPLGQPVDVVFAKALPGFRGAEG
ncbi:PAS domain-containing protein, partial [Escherichia coli]|nr:PAS domain-containing protein [Escherichia coli]